MTFDVITLFPGMLQGLFEEGILSRARAAGRIGVRVHDLRRFGSGPHRQVDDVAYGGGGGMVLKPEPIFEAVEWIRARFPATPDRVILLSPQGGRLDHVTASRLSGYARVVLICGRYEGVDERVRLGLADEELSIGDVVLTGGEVPAAAVVDAVSRFVPGVVGRAEAVYRDSFATGLLDFPHYTRPACYRGLAVPPVLLSGDHEEIAAWRSRTALAATRAKRPDLPRPESDQSAPGGRG